MSVLDRVDELEETIELRTPVYGFALADVPQPGPWMDRGRCRTLPMTERARLHFFFPERGEDVAQAKAVCARCPVIDDCREYALEAGRSLSGIWGGTSGKDRKRIAAAPPAPEPECSTTRPPARARGALYRWLEALTEHEGRWARQHFTGRTSANAMASLLNSGQRPVPPGRFTIEARREHSGGSYLYARYDGPGLDEAVC